MRCGLNVVERRFFEICFCLAAASLSVELRADYSQADFGSVSTPQENKLNEIRDQEIQQLKMILRRSITKEQRADLLLRLGEVYTEKYRHYFFKLHTEHHEVSDVGWDSTARSWMATHATSCRWTRLPTWLRRRRIPRSGASRARR